jgi:hypothetical protein
VVLDHALASIAADDPNGDGVSELRVEIDYLEGYRGKPTLFTDPHPGGLRAVEYTDDPGGDKMQIELMDAAKACFPEDRSGTAAIFRMVDARFPDRTDSTTIRWNGKAWMRTPRTMPGGGAPDGSSFPFADQFP